MTKEIEEKVKEHAKMLQHEFVHGRMINILAIAENMAEFIHSLLTPSASVQERAKEFKYADLRNAGNSYADNQWKDEKDFLKQEYAATDFIEGGMWVYKAYLAGAAGNGMQWVKASERIPDGIRVPVKYNGNYNVIYKTGDGYAFDDHEGMRVFPEDWGNILWLDEPHSMQGEVGRLRDDDKEFITDALNAYWHEANARLLLTDLGDIERKNYERQLSRSKELMEALTKYPKIEIEDADKRIERGEDGWG